MLAVPSFLAWLWLGMCAVFVEGFQVSTPSTSHLQQCWDALGEGKGLELTPAALAKARLVTEGDFPQAQSTWSKAYMPLRITIAEEPGRSLAMLVLPQGSILSWHRHPLASCALVPLFGQADIEMLKLESGFRDLAAAELKDLFADTFATGGSEDSDCVCRGGRCPRTTDCPFWVERRSRESKGRRAQLVSEHPLLPLVTEEQQQQQQQQVLVSGPDDLRRVTAVSTCALLELHRGDKQPQLHYRVLDGRKEVIPALKPGGVTPRVGVYMGARVQ